MSEEEAIDDPPWLTHAVDQRLAMLSEVISKHRLPRADVIATFLTEPPESASALQLSLWERTCDNCGTICPPSSDFYQGTTTRMLANGQRVVIVFGICTECRPS